MSAMIGTALRIILVSWVLILPALAQEQPVAGNSVLISVPDQKLRIVRNGHTLLEFPISTSRFGIGDEYGSYRTPLGRMTISDKIGGDLVPGAVLKGRRPTGEVLVPNAPGRDPIVTRILRLRGEEPQNQHAEARAIYIHGTPEERTIGRKSSYGCIRMRSQDVIALYRMVAIGTPVVVDNASIKKMAKAATPRATGVSAVSTVASARAYGNYLREGY